MPFSAGHDAYFLQQGLTQMVAVTSAVGASTASAFGSQTRAVRVLALGNASSNAAVFVKFYSIGETSQASSTADCPVPVNRPVEFKINPGQLAGVISADAAASYRCYFSELTD
jgi:hypothetical protein